LGITLACTGAYFQQDILILKHFTNDTQVGLFSSGYRIIVAMVSFITPAFAVLLPELSRKASQSANDVSMLSSKVAHYFLAATIPGVVVMALLAKTLLVLLYGASFAVAAPVLQFLSVIVFLGSLEFLFAMGLVSLNRAWWILIATGLGLAVNVGLNLLWIPKWEFMGATYAKLVGEIVMFCGYVGLFQLAVGGSLFPRWMLRPIAAGVVMVLLVVVALPLGMTLTIIIGLGAYILSYLATGLLKVRLPDSD
jgi:O-antigen/teichoic acid export membrane protein